MSGLGRALLDEIGPEDLAVLAERLAPYLGTPAPVEVQTPSRVRIPPSPSTRPIRRPLARLEPRRDAALRP
jgi:hypothetical protein